ncbi:hypothetical protein L6452_19191 [Arctium lappa]|uniref:Uncharacterized protein n=1 Tax=Arctium lappa TaxID=4217 RepID=A0ACB9B7W5_ARCLA|nr:hypothetical protein L6452_19191 [Arctium lappa]
MNACSSSSTADVLNYIERSSLISNGQHIKAEVVDTLFEDSRDYRIVTEIDRNARWPDDLEDDRFIPTGQTSLLYNNHHVSNKQDVEILGAMKSNGQVSQTILEDEDEDFEYVGATPIGSKFWYPNVDVSLKPKVGDYYESVEACNDVCAFCDYNRLLLELH